MKLQELRHNLGEIDAVYLLDEDTLHIALILLPAGMPTAYTKRRADLMQTPEVQRMGIVCPAWSVGSLCHVALRHQPQSSITGKSLLHGYSTKQFRYVQQTVDKKEETVITTLLRSAEGFEISHVLSHTCGDAGVEVCCTFFNRSQRTVQLDMITSFSLDNLSPFSTDDAPNRLYLHRFYGGWSSEGRRRCDAIEELNLERTWFNSRAASERFGSIGSYPVDRYFPVAAVEDRTNGVFWAAQLAHNASWQMELCRADDTLTFAGGLADCEFGSWHKEIQAGEYFTAPKAFLTVASGDLETACNRMTALHQKYVRQQPASEQTLPVICNEWCTSWGHPSEEEILNLAKKLQNTGVKYIVIDAGWSRTTRDNQGGQGGAGVWDLDSDKFPSGLQALSQKLADMGFRLGIWFEFEVTTRGAAVFEKAYDHLHLQRDEELILSGDDRSFWDFRRQEVIEYLREKVLEFLRKNEIGFLKVDYNGSVGIGCDGAESLGEGLRQQMEAVRNFFGLLRKELPELVIENCASGGHRLEPSMMDITALSSGSDAHESGEIPVIAANTDLLVLPRQNEIWCVLDASHDSHKLAFHLAAGFLGRLCISGDILTLPENNWRMVCDALALYEKARDVLLDCQVHLFQFFKDNSIRHVKGTQAVILVGKNEEILVVCHSFEESWEDPILAELPSDNYRIAEQFGDAACACIRGKELLIPPVDDNRGFVLLLQLKDLK